MARTMKKWDVYWAPEGRKIATVEATTAKAAKRKAPMPYRKFLGEMYVEPHGVDPSAPLHGPAPKQNGKQNGMHNARLRINPRVTVPAKVKIERGGVMRVFVDARHMGKVKRNPLKYKAARIPGYKRFAVFRVGDVPSTKNWVSGPYKTKREAQTNADRWNRD